MGNVPQFGLMECVHLDHFGEIHILGQPYRHVLSMVDHHSGYTELVATKTCTAQETAQHFYERYLLRHGGVSHVLSDREKAFLGSFSDALFSLCRLKH